MPGLFRHPGFNKRYRSRRVGPRNKSGVKKNCTKRPDRRSAAPYAEPLHATPPTSPTVLLPQYTNAITARPPTGGRSEEETLKYQQQSATPKSAYACKKKI